jgi:adenine-specific DNA methylase
MKPKADDTGVSFSVQTDVPVVGGNSAQRREHDKRVGRGTMTASGVSCPCCCIPDTVSMTLDDIQFESKADRSGAELVCVVVDGPDGKEYRQPSEEELHSVECIQQTLQDQLAEVPYGTPSESINPARPSPNARGLSGLTRYGLDRFDKLFNNRQLLTLLSFAKVARSLGSVLGSSNYPADWIEAIKVYLSLAINRLADRNSSICHWDMGRETISNTFQRYALRINWDYCEVNPFADTTGSYISAVAWIALVIEHATHAISQAALPAVYCDSAAGDQQPISDIILTDPPYYDAIPYADLSDFFYVWLRRTVDDLYPGLFTAPLTIKDEELIQHAGRMDGDNLLARQFYENGMARAFLAAKEHLSDDGRFVVV